MSGFGLPGVVGTVFGSAFGTSIVLRNRGRWVLRAHKLADTHNLPLPEYLAARVASWLRSKAALTGAAGVGVALFNGWTFSSTLEHRAGSSFDVVFTAGIVSVPGLLIGYGLLCSAATWNSKDRRGAAHFSKPRVRDVFLTREWAVVGATAVTALILGSWGLKRHGVDGWLDAWPAAAVATLVMWWVSCRALLNRPSRAANSLELQWDDLLRYQQVREFTIVSTFGPASYLALLDAMAEGSMRLSVYVTAIAAALAAVAYIVLRQGRDLWRRPWTTTT